MKFCKFSTKLTFGSFLPSFLLHLFVAATVTCGCPFQTAPAPSCDLHVHCGFQMFQAIDILNDNISHISNYNL